MRNVRRRDVVEPDKLPVRCFTCRRIPKLCTCFEYRIVQGASYFRPGPEGGFEDRWNVFVDNVATEPLASEHARLWQARRNAKIWRRPQFIDGFLLMTIYDPEIAEEVESDIQHGTFHVDRYRDRSGVRVPAFEKALQKRLPFFRHPRVRKKAV